MAKTPNVTPSDPYRDGLKAIRKQRYQAENAQEFWSLVRRVVLLAIIVWVLLSKVFMFTQASGNSMFPAVKDGDLLIGYRLQRTYAKNDIVLYEHDGKLCVGASSAVQATLSA